MEPSAIRDKISHSTEEAPAHLHADNWSLDFLTDYIIQNHHTYVLNTIPKLEELLIKVENAHGQNHPELSAIFGHFTSLAKELMEHMQKEEQILFLVIKGMADGSKKGIKTSVPFGSVRNPIRVMKMNMPELERIWKASAG